MPHYPSLVPWDNHFNGLYFFAFTISFYYWSIVDLKYCVSSSVCTCMLSRFSRVRLFATLWTAARQAPLSMDSPGKNTGAGCHAPSRGSFRPRERIWVSSLLHWQEFFTTSSTWEVSGVQHSNYTYIHIYTHIYIHTYIFNFRFFSLTGLYKILSIVSCAIQ